MAIFADVTPLVEPLSVDEAFLDISGARRLAGRPGTDRDPALRARIAGELDLTATVGGAATKFMAKLASGLAKPDGLLLVPPSRRTWPCCTRYRSGHCGESAPRRPRPCEALGLSTVGEIAAMDRTALIRHVGRAVGAKLHDLANGLDDRFGRDRIDRRARSVPRPRSAPTPPTGRSSTGSCSAWPRRRLDGHARPLGCADGPSPSRCDYEDFSTVSRSRDPADADRSVRASSTQTAAGLLLDRLGHGRLVRLVGDPP